MLNERGTMELEVEKRPQKIRKKVIVSITGFCLSTISDSRQSPHLRTTSPTACCSPPLDLFDLQSHNSQAMKRMIPASAKQAKDVPFKEDSHGFKEFSFVCPGLQKSFSEYIKSKTKYLEPKVHEALCLILIIILA